MTAMERHIRLRNGKKDFNFEIFCYSQYRLHRHVLMRVIL